VQLKVGLLSRSDILNLGSSFMDCNNQRFYFVRRVATIEFDVMLLFNRHYATRKTSATFLSQALKSLPKFNCR
jgi:hypothetical protein